MVKTRRHRCQIVVCIITFLSLVSCGLCVPDQSVVHICTHLLKVTSGIFHMANITTINITIFTEPLENLKISGRIFTYKYGINHASR